MRSDGDALKRGAILPGLLPLYEKLPETALRECHLPKVPAGSVLVAITGQTSTLTAAISHLEREIDLIREYRTLLVADVVTGKLDVREAAARLPAQEGDVADIGESSDVSAELDDDDVTDADPEAPVDA